MGGRWAKLPLMTGSRGRESIFPVVPCLSFLCVSQAFAPRTGVRANHWSWNAPGQQMPLCPGTCFMQCGWKQSQPLVFLTRNCTFAALHFPVCLQGVLQGRWAEAQLKLQRISDTLFPSAGRDRPKRLLTSIFLGLLFSGSCLEVWSFDKKKKTKSEMHLCPTHENKY